MLGQKASEEGIHVVEGMAGVGGRLNYDAIPAVVYTDPEIASVGLTDRQAGKAGRKVKVGEFYFVGNGRAGTMGKEEGLVLIVSDGETGAVLGVHIMGPRATELISLGVMAMQNRLTIRDLKNTVLPHLTFSESFFEAAMATDGEAVHLLLGKPGDGP